MPDSIAPLAMAWEATGLVITINNAIKIMRSERGENPEYIINPINMDRTPAVPALPAGWILV